SLCPVGRDPPYGTVRGQSGLACFFGSGSEHGGNNAPQGLRHDCRREAYDSGLPLSVPEPRPSGKSWRRLSLCSRDVESIDINAGPNKTFYTRTLSRYGTERPT